VFRIFLDGSVPDYSYSLSDRLAKDQLWAAGKSQNGADVEIGVKGQKLFAHKAVLAARSAVISTEFTSGQPEGTASVSTNGLHQIQIDHVEPSTVEQFLYFIYTGESMETFSNEELLELADNYET
jgi:hypothetical protein